MPGNGVYHFDRDTANAERGLNKADIEKQGEQKSTDSPLIHTFSMISPCFFIYTRGRRKRMERGVDQDENHISEGC